MLQLISGLLRNGRLVPTAVVFNEGVLFDRLSALGIPVEVADETTMSPLRQIGVMRRHFVANRTRIVHTHGFKENILGTIAQHVARVPKSLRTVHGNPEILANWGDPTRKLVQIFDALIARLGQDAVVAVSRQLAQTLIEQYPSKTIRISNFIEVGTKPPELPPTRTSGSDYRVALVGRLVPVKRIDLFIETVAQLRDLHKLPVRGIVFGDGPLLNEMRVLAD
ncbi:MAG: glycosyltransferase, partial [Pseudomonadota bacterium]|nr:glycosyltransferase [Pseudomonadota bacterium]